MFKLNQAFPNQNSLDEIRFWKKKCGFNTDIEILKKTRKIKQIENIYLHKKTLLYIQQKMSLENFIPKVKNVFRKLDISV